MILHYTIQICEILLTISILIGFYRMVRGPTSVDRIIAFDLIVLTVVAFTALLSIEEETAQFLELILVVSLLGFFSTVALVKAIDSSNRGINK